MTSYLALRDFCARRLLSTVVYTDEGGKVRKIPELDRLKISGQGTFLVIRRHVERRSWPALAAFSQRSGCCFYSL